MSDADHGMVQVVMSAEMLARVEAWLKSSGLLLYPIPVTDDLPTYGVGRRLAQREEGPR